MSRTPACLVLVLLAALAGAGCGTSGDRRDARATVERFYDAIRADRGAEACAQLTEATVEEVESRERQPCAAAITRLGFEGGHVVATEVYVTSARVDLARGESAFLDKEPSGWKLAAIGCSPPEGSPDLPYDCEVAS